MQEYLMRSFALYENGKKAIYQRSTTIGRITRGYLSCNDSAWVYTWQVDTLLYRRVLNLSDSRARCLVKYMEAHSVSLDIDAHRRVIYIAPLFAPCR